MPKVRIDLFDQRPLLDIASYARRGPGERFALSAAEIDHIRRTVHGTPEVMVKVLSSGGRDLRSVQRHLDYLDRRGELPLETDDGEQLKGKGVSKELLDDWDLDLDQYRGRSDLSATVRRQAKLVHKILFSMPPGTPPERLLAAARDCAREEFALKHRYAMVVHTDEPHPHVHMVVKAVSEQGVRLNIRKATLREWRTSFAHHLRKHGVPANATERAVRGQTQTRKLDGIYRALRRGVSTHMRAREKSVAHEVSRGGLVAEEGRSAIERTRVAVIRGWYVVVEELARRNELRLSNAIGSFLAQMPLPLSEKQLLAQKLTNSPASEQVRDQQRMR